MNSISKLITGSFTSAAKSLISSGIKKGAKDLFSKQFSKSEKDINEEIQNNIGYLTSNYTLDKNKNIIYKSSSVFFYEWLSNSSHVNGKISKDEETGLIYFDNKLLNNDIKMSLISKFMSDTKIKAASVPSHFEGAVKLMEPSDYNSILFDSKFSGWDPTKSSVIDVFIKNCFGTALNTNEEYANVLFKKWIVGTAKRAISPGVTLDGCLVLKGPAGVGKTAFFRNILPKPFEKRTGEVYCDIKSSQKFVESIVGKTVACFDELSVLDHAKTEETFKQLLSSQAIDVRLAWRRNPQRFLLRSGFAATTNREKFIPDPFFSRRLWTIELNDSQRLNFDYYFANQNDLWQEAVYLAKNNYSQILSREDQKIVEENNSKYLMKN